jgi:hypothetical protein
VFLVRTRFQNGFLCDFIVYYKVLFLDFCLEYKNNDGLTFSPDLKLKNILCLALICTGNNSMVSSAFNLGKTCTSEFFKDDPNCTRNHTEKKCLYLTQKLCNWIDQSEQVAFVKFIATISCAWWFKNHKKIFDVVQIRSF